MSRGDINPKTGPMLLTHIKKNWNMTMNLGETYKVAHEGLLYQCNKYDTENKPHTDQSVCTKYEVCKGNICMIELRKSGGPDFKR